MYRIGKLMLDTHYHCGTMGANKPEALGHTVQIRLAAQRDISPFNQRTRPLRGDATTTSVAYCTGKGRMQAVQF